MASDPRARILLLCQIQIIQYICIIWICIYVYIGRYTYRYIQTGNLSSWIIWNMNRIRIKWFLLDSWVASNQLIQKPLESCIEANHFIQNLLSCELKKKSKWARYSKRCGVQHIKTSRGFNEPPSTGEGLGKPYWIDTGKIGIIHMSGGEYIKQQCPSFQVYLDVKHNI